MPSIRRVVRCAALLASLAVASACSGNPPDKEIKQAEAAIAAARGAGANQYAKAEFAAAQDALKRATDAVADRDYRLALNHALDARERAEAAAKQAADGKVIARADADRALRDLTAALADARARLKAARPGRVPRVVGVPSATTDMKDAVQEARSRLERGDYAVAVLADEIRQDEVALQKARTQIEAGDYAAATAALTGVTAGLRAATHDLEAAQSAPTRRRH
jgi:hypothetical protein